MERLSCYTPPNFFPERPIGYLNDVEILDMPKDDSKAYIYIKNNSRFIRTRAVFLGIATFNPLNT